MTLGPQNINKDAWYYEEREGLYLVVYSPKRETVHVVIPWAMVRRSLSRKDRKRLPRRGVK